MKKDLLEFVGSAIMMVAVVVAILLLTVPFAWFSAHNEATSYRKFCKTPVTTWDAVWLDLRIDECR